MLAIIKKYKDLKDHYNKNIAILFSIHYVVLNVILINHHINKSWSI